MIINAVSRKISFFIISGILFFVVCIITLSGCGAVEDKLDGKYIDELGNYMEFHTNGNAEIAMPNFFEDVVVTGTYKIETKQVWVFWEEKTLYFTYLNEKGIEQFWNADFKFGDNNSSIFIDSVELRHVVFNEDGEPSGFVMPWWGWVLIIVFGLGAIGAIWEKITGNR